MRILFVTPYFYPAEAFGGPVKVAFDVGKGLVKRGHEVVLFTSDAKDLENRLDVKSGEVNGMRVYYFRNLSMFFAKWSKLFITHELSRAMKSDLGYFDIVHAHEYRTYQNIIAHRFTQKFDVPYVLQTHGGLPKIGRRSRKLFYDILFGSSLLADASKVIALTRTEVQQCRNMGVPKEKIRVIPNGIDLSDYVNLPPKGSFKKKFNIDEDEKIVLYLGRIHKVKGIDILVRAFANVIEKLDDVKLVIVGPDDGYLVGLEALVKALRIEDNVLILGPLYGNNKLEALVDADVFVLPSRYETFPNVVLEAYACSKPVIASNVESIPDIVQHGKTGLLFQACEVEELEKMITYTFRHPEEAEDMGHRARKLVEEKFSINKVVDSLEELYLKVLENNEPSKVLPKRKIQIAAF